ncbi:hypothetical protein F5B20DRAFT_395638 [Whalleya microplaca]|nr:hypothetical protein F5B20DRAFT_395638 [Whalleya microplaca]
MYLRYLLTRETDPDKCHPSANVDLCEKPNAASNTTGIVVGTTFGLLVSVTLGTLLFLHLKRRRRDAREWPKDNQELDDYGLAPERPKNAPSPSTNANAGAKPSNTYRPPRVDPDDNDDGHLPPPGRKNRDSLSSLARSLRGNPEAYKPRPDDTSHDMKPTEPTSQL